jgi:hypothetical protein
MKVRECCNNIAWNFVSLYAENVGLDSIEY